MNQVSIKPGAVHSQPHECCLRCSLVRGVVALLLLDALLLDHSADGVNLSLDVVRGRDSPQPIASPRGRGPLLPGKQRDYSSPYTQSPQHTTEPSALTPQLFLPTLIPTLPW